METHLSNLTNIKKVENLQQNRRQMTCTWVLERERVLNITIPTPSNSFCRPYITYSLLPFFSTMFLCGSLVPGLKVTFSSSQLDSVRLLGSILRRSIVNSSTVVLLKGLNQYVGLSGKFDFFLSKVSSLNSSFVNKKLSPRRVLSPYIGYSIHLRLCQG